MIHAAARHAIALLLANGFGMVLPAQTPAGTVAGVVVSQESGMTLPYGVVAVPALGRERFTTVNGSFILDDLPAGPVRLMVRRLGYVPKELTVTVHEGMTEMEVTTRFDEVLPSIPVIAKVSSQQTFNTELRGVQISSAFDEQRLIQFVFLGRRSGEDKKP